MIPDHDVVAQSDIIDERMKLLRPPTGGPWLVIVLMLVVVIGQAVTLLSLRDMAQTNKKLTVAHDRLIRVEVTGLKQKIADQEATITAYKEVVQQATDGLILMAETITDLGGTPPTVVLRPSSTTSTTSTTAPKSHDPG